MGLVPGLIKGLGVTGGTILKTVFPDGWKKPIPAPSRGAERARLTAREHAPTQGLPLRALLHRSIIEEPLRQAGRVPAAPIWHLPAFGVYAPSVDPRILTDAEYLAS